MPAWFCPRSGAVLCLGVPMDRICKAVVLQNFETPIVPSLLQSDHNEPPPVYVACPTVCQGPGPDKLFSTLRRMTSRSSICAFLAVAPSKAVFCFQTKYEKQIFFVTTKNTLSIRSRFPGRGVLAKEGYLPSRSDRSHFVELLKKKKHLLVLTDWLLLSGLSCRRWSYVYPSLQDQRGQVVR
jgi:hypothetical protein